MLCELPEDVRQQLKQDLAEAKAIHSDACKKNSGILISTEDNLGKAEEVTDVEVDGRVTEGLSSNSALPSFSQVRFIWILDNGCVHACFCYILPSASFFRS